MDKEIPILDLVDVTFFTHLMVDIEPDCPAMKMFQEVRNLIAHMTEIELDKFVFQDRFHMIIEAVNVGFQSNQAVWQKWRTVLESIRTDKISNPEELQSQFQRQAETVRWEVSQKYLSFGNVKDCQNVNNIYNITVHGDAAPNIPGLYLEMRCFLEQRSKPVACNDVNFTHRICNK